MIKPYEFDTAAARLLAIRISIFQFQTLPFEQLKSRNLRSDLHELGLIPKGYFSYCCSQKAPFRKPGSLDRSLVIMCENGELGMLKPSALRKKYGLNINSRATLYRVREAFKENYGSQLIGMQSDAFSPTVPVNYPIARLQAEQLEAQHNANY